MDTLEMNMLECTPCDKETNTVIKDGTGTYKLYPLKAQWIFPWHTKVMLNINKLVIPKDSIGIMYTNPSQDNIEVKTKIINDDISIFENNKSIYVKTLGLLPKRIKHDNPIALMNLIKQLEAYLIIE